MIVDEFLFVLASILYFFLCTCISTVLFKYITCTDAFLSYHGNLKSDLNYRYPHAHVYVHSPSSIREFHATCNPRFFHVVRVAHMVFAAGTPHVIT